MNKMNLRIGEYILDSILIIIDDFWHNQLNDFPLDFFYPDWLVNFRISICNYIERDVIKELK